MHTHTHLVKMDARGPLCVEVIAIVTLSKIQTMKDHVHLLNKWATHPSIAYLRESNQCMKFWYPLHQIPGAELSI